MAPGMSLGARTAAVGAALACASLCLVPAPATGASPAMTAGGRVYLVQGVPGASVDVSVDGDDVATDLAAGEVAGPIELGAGSHRVVFSGEGWTAEAPVDGGRASQDVVVHLPVDRGADPAVTTFDNDLAPAAPGQGRLSVAHTAVVPPADVVADDRVLFANISDGEFVTEDLAAGTYAVAVVPTGGGEALLGPGDVTVTAGTLTRVFAIGAPDDDSLTAVMQRLPLERPSAAGPSGVGSGVAGPSPAHDQRARLWVAPLVAAAWGAAYLLWRTRRVRG